MRNIFHKPVETNFKKSISMVILTVDYYISHLIFLSFCVNHLKWIRIRFAKDVGYRIGFYSKYRHFLV